MNEPEEPRASIIIVSDFVCPWCYIGLVEVERLRQEYDFDVHFAPFYLHPETPPEGMPPRRITLPDAPPTPIELRAEDLGIKFTRGRTWASNSYLSLQAADFASEYGDEWRFHRRMFKAYFEDLEDIGKLDNVVRIGADAGLDEAGLRAALEEGRYRERVDQEIGWSRRIGVTAVPTFVFNQQYGMVGAQELDAFRYMMEQIGAPKRQLPTPRPSP
jgi:predicted DsbA family dithiol-disulfide isomerase